MEIQNTTLGGKCSQKVHLRTHQFGATSGRRLTINEDDFVGISADSPDCLLHIRDTSLHTVLERAIVLGSDSSYTTTGLNIGNHNSRPFIWAGNNGTASVNAETFTHGFGWLYRQNGNLQLIRRNGSTTNTSVMTYSRANGCVTFTNTSPGCGSDDRLKFNETDITNALDTIMKLSPETYDKISAPNNDDDEYEHKNEADLFKFDISNSQKESGFIAQEVEEIEELKHLVRTDNDVYALKSVNYFGIIPYNTKAIQELKLQNDDLKQKNTNLVNKMYELEMKIDMLMKHVKL